MTNYLIWFSTLAVTGIGCFIIGGLGGWLFADLIDKWFDRKKPKS